VTNYAIQNSDVWSALRHQLRIQGGPIETPPINFGGLNLTWDISQGGWARLNPFICQTPGVSIAGTQFDYTDTTGIASDQTFGTRPLVDHNRVVDHAHVFIYGGTAANIYVQVGLQVGGIFIICFAFQRYANPGEYRLPGTPWIIPEGTQLRVLSGVGGAGDSLQLTYSMRWAEPGSELPI
jgi:hypothetical protein